MNCLGLDATDRSGPSPPHIQDFRSELYIPPRSHRSEEHTSELQSPCNLVCRLLLEKKNNSTPTTALSTGTIFVVSRGRPSSYKTMALQFAIPHRPFGHKQTTGATIPLDYALPNRTT